ncbi:MAG: patatin-like phospholipase family protein [Candidatus Contendobacter sp.]|jgi:NTE family protein|nr:patatin-like phospholipase family protein [Gammaproteobacteria bacterium]MCC8994011.1 patatin-like phospholipase family protein [Candidatus Contendobacter sp.]
MPDRTLPRCRFPRSGILLLTLLILMLRIFDPAPEAVAAGSGRPRIGLVLGGGGARGIAHIGVLKMLEELRIPVDCIAGTSMGSIIGGLYASGMTPDQMSEAVQRIDWPMAFTDGPPRADLPFRIKQEQRVLLTNSGVGIKDGSVQLPRSLLQGQNLSLLLEELALPVAEIRDFDRLRIPYRAVATDLATGNPVVLGSGNLATAMRASMSIPSALAPVELDGKMLVDGGVADNLPVDVARALCKPEVIIAVDVGAPLAPASELTSVLSITAQLTTILTVRNTEQQLKTLGPKDFQITPSLGDLSSIDFDRSAEAIQIGYAAAQAQRSALIRLSTSPDDYRAYLAARPDRPSTDHPVIDFIRINNNTRLADAVIEKQVHIQPGEQLDPEQLNRNLNVIYGMGEFQQVSYSLVEEDGKTGLVVEAREKYIGNDRLNFGLFLGANLKGDSMFNISAAYTMSQLNPLGGQWRSFVQLGSDLALETDFYQPLNANQTYYIDPYLSYQQYNLDLQDTISAVDSSSYRVREVGLGLELGRNLEHWGQVSLGLHYSAGRNDLRFGPSSADEGEFNNSGYSLRFAVDTLDNLNFPTSGSFANLRYYSALTGLGADQNFQTLSMDAFKPYTWGRSTLIPRFRLAGTLDGDPGVENLLLLGGFLNLSGYQLGQISGQYLALGELIYMYRLNDASAAFTIPLYAGGSLEIGGAWMDTDEIDSASLIPAGSLFLGADTPLGPFYLGAGFADGDRASMYLILGKLF